ncbi:hypothetical protein ABE288_20440 [Bacillus salipaludis]|uniref:hypothetical protein n=1 Tax=Bacillus salipaludis TaxID=2547811 RepID=UPI003D1A3CF8
MNFIEYLISRHLIKKGTRAIREVSARQYNSRLENMKNKNIYNGEKEINEHIIAKIKNHYTDKTNHYPRTLEYYLEYLNYKES